MLSAILTTATGKSTIEYASQSLFEPLDWLIDYRNINLGGVGLQISTRDMLKFGLLYINMGLYDRSQILTKEWVESAMQAQITTDDIIPYGPDYGYYWWVGAMTGYDYYFANGYGGQFIVVVPDLEQIVVATCNWHYSASVAGQQWYEIITIIMEEIIPTVEWS